MIRSALSPPLFKNCFLCLLCPKLLEKRWTRRSASYRPKIKNCSPLLTLCLPNAFASSYLSFLLEWYISTFTLCPRKVILSLSKYRPRTLLSRPSKVLKQSSTKLFSACSIFILLPDRQFGFFKKHCTGDLLVSLLILGHPFLTITTKLVFALGISRSFDRI